MGSRKRLARRCLAAAKKILAVSKFNGIQVTVNPKLREYEELSEWVDIMNAVTAGIRKQMGRHSKPWQLYVEEVQPPTARVGTWDASGTVTDEDGEEYSFFVSDIKVYGHPGLRGWPTVDITHQEYVNEFEED